MGLAEIIKQTVEKMSDEEGKLLSEVIEMNKEYVQYERKSYFESTYHDNEKRILEKYHMFVLPDGSGLEYKYSPQGSPAKIDEQSKFVDVRYVSKDELPKYALYIERLKQYHSGLKSELEKKEAEVKKLLDKI